VETGREPVIEIAGLVKRYGGTTAVDGIDLTVFEGEIFGILGPNGAGKTTTLEMIEGLRKPDAGTIRVAGLDAVADSDKVRQLIGVQLQSTALFDYLNARELIELFAALYGVDSSKGRSTSCSGWSGSRRRPVRRLATSPVASGSGSRSRWPW
jgi:ABC-2 type transport system ATP-binding protein